MSGKKKITQSQLKSILAQHKKWLDNCTSGKRADLSGAMLCGLDMEDVLLAGANLSGAIMNNVNLRGADLSGADLRGAQLIRATLLFTKLDSAKLNDADLAAADLSDAVLSGADLTGAELSTARLCGADLSSAVLRCATLEGADLAEAEMSGADLTYADLRNANLRDTAMEGVNFLTTNLRGATLTGAYLRNAENIATAFSDKRTNGFHLVPPECGEYTGWKCASGFLVKLVIPADAMRSSATTRSCRASKAVVQGIYNMDGVLLKRKYVHSDTDEHFVYRVGKTNSVADFEPDRWCEHAPGIHHYMTMREAVEWANTGFDE